ncbi:MAG: OmpA family protein [Candidatus Kapabacteria bacterium]|nr:OmpA family protein [Candidatus Kapabacteria bacterium]
MIYNVNDVPNNPDPNSSNSGVTLSIPFGIGFSYNFSKSVGLDFNIYPNMSLTDNYNPVYDDIFDASWVTRLGVHFTVAEFEKDSDGDGLSDKREIELGTNPNNPDTDGDGLLDGEEVNKYKTNPLDPDTDGGGVKDGVEVATGANPLDPDDDILSIPVGEKIILKGIEFVTGKADITPKSERILNFALKALQAAPNMELEIVGHTDNVGDREMNIKLSLDRAESVKKWLVDRGIAASRLTTKGVGPDQPLVPNTSDENRQRNRRVEFFRAK